MSDVIRLTTPYSSATFGTCICHQWHGLLQQHPVRLLPCAHIRPLQNVLNAAARLILHKRKYDRITATIRDLLHWLPVQQSIEYNMCVLVYKCLHQAAPIHLSELCIPVATFAGRSHLRSAVKVCLVTSYCRTKNYGQRSFSYCGPVVNSSYIRSAPVACVPFSITAAQCRLAAFYPNFRRCS